MTQRFHTYLSTPPQMKMCTQKDFYMIIHSIITTQKPQTRSKCPSTYECINKMWYSHMLEYSRQ